ncbi:Rfc5 [Nucleospora cyclopteri]
MPSILPNQKFTDKYRPKNLNEVAGNENIIKCLKSFKLENLPNMLFFGPPGTGKTTSIKALIYDKMSRNNIIELNASDERGIETVRTTIKQFAEASCENRLVILDEADSMSKDAQGALRRVMEDFPNCRFCLICNFSRKIIDPIQSRCAKFRFNSISLGEVKKHMVEIIKKEEIPVKDSEALEILAKSANGDMRKLINDLQGIKAGFNEISKENIEEFLGITSKTKIDRIFQLLTNKQLSFKQRYKKIIEENVECADVIKQISEIVLFSEIPDKLRIIKELSEIEYNLSLGCSDKIQFQGFVGAFE